MVRQLMQRLQDLKAAGLNGLNLIATWVQTKIRPLQHRPLLICE